MFMALCTVAIAQRQPEAFVKPVTDGMLAARRHLSKSVMRYLISSLATSRRRSHFKFQAAIGVLQRLQPENLVNLLGDLAIKRELRRDKNGVRAKPFRHRHCRAQAVFAGFVGRGANHRARAIPSHHHGLAAQMGLFAQFYPCVECVHVYVDDFAWGHGGHGVQKAA